jgi:hypothetical protein
MQRDEADRFDNVPVSFFQDGFFDISDGREASLHSGPV